MGDAVLMTPALAALRAGLPSSELCLVLDQELVDLFEDHPLVDRVLPLGGRAIDKMALAGSLRREGFDAVINFHGGPTSAWLTAASGAPVRVGRDTYRFQFLYTVRAPRPQEVFSDPSAIHTVHAQASLVAALGLPVRDLSLQLRVPHGARERLTKRLEALGASSANYAVLQPTASFATKQWSEHRFVDLIQRLRKQTGLSFVVSLPAWSRLADSFSSEFPVLSGLTSSELVALMDGARLYVGNDSGPMHVAAAVGTPVVGIFGSSDPKRWHPWRVPHRTLRVGLDCSPCHGKWCANPKQLACLTELSVESVLEAAHSLLSEQTLLAHSAEAR
jgi:ADP-heptose:LPS heptosyltransferase